MVHESSKKKIELIFPESDVEIESKPVRRGPGGKMVQKFATSIDDITNWFNQGLQVNYQKVSVGSTGSGTSMYLQAINSSQSFSISNRNWLTRV